MIHMLCARRSTRCRVVFLLSLQRKRRRHLQRVPEAFECCKCAHDVNSCLLCTSFFQFTICFWLSRHSTCVTLFSQVRLVYLIFAVPQTQMKELILFFDRAGESTGGEKVEKELWLACQSTGNSTGGRAHGPTAMLSFF